jgi:hypothetical protein
MEHLPMHRTTIVLCLALSSLGAIGGSALAGQRAHGAHGNSSYRDSGPRGLNLFGFGYGEECDRRLLKAIEIDTPDPRYWNAYYECIGLF